MYGSASGTNRRSGGPSRRTMLAAAGLGLSVATSGCVREVRSAVNRNDVGQLSLTITTLPADGDRESILLAREIRSTLEAVGIAVEIEMRSEEEFRRSVLVNNDFDVYVGQHPGDVDPDFLYETVHSRYAEEAGWQNPFGFADLTVDDLLEDQREVDGDEREEAVTDVLETIAADAPFVPICAADEYRLARTDRVDGWGDDHPTTRLGYLGLEMVDADAILRAAHTDPRASENLNPLAVEYRNYGTLVEVLYDSLSTVVDGEYEPWLANDWTFDDGTMTVTLREDCRFHDGTPLTADDVAFTYRFLADTTLGDSAFPSPTPRYRGHVAAVDEIDVLEDHRLELTVETGEAVAERALSVPILPEHVWRERASAASVPGVRLAEGTTEAVVTDNLPVVGSGPYQFDDHTVREHVTLERYDDHFTLREGVDLPEPTAGAIRIGIDPRSTSAIELVESDDADVTSLPLESYVVDDVLESTGDDVAVVESPSWSFYHLGFNVRKAPFTNPNFRRVVARLVDQSWLVESVFDGHARPIATPVSDEWTPEELAWDGEDPVAPFLGAAGDVDTGAARDAFEAAGFRYADDGTLRVRR